MLLIQLKMMVFGRLLTSGATVVVMMKCDDKTLKQRWLHRKAATFDDVRTSTTSGLLKMPMATRLQKSEL